MSPVLNKEGFRKVIAGLTGLSDGGTVWGLAPQPFVSDQDRAIVKLRLFNISQDMWDEYRRDYGPDGYPADAFVTRTLGNRTLTITFRVESYDADLEALELLDAIYTGMQTVETDMAFDAIGLAFVEAHPATTVDYVVDERNVYAATQDFVFAGVAEKVVSVVRDGTINPAPSAPGTYIDSVNMDNVVPGTLT